MQRHAKAQHVYAQQPVQICLSDSGLHFCKEIPYARTLTPRAFTRTAQGATLNRLTSTSTPATSVLKGSHWKVKI